MAWPTSLQVALKEWAVVCSALESGRQLLLLRMGSIWRRVVVVFDAAGPRRADRVR